MSKNKIVLTSIVAVVALIGSIFGFLAIQRMQAIEKANTLILMEKYEEGIAIYEKLLSQKYDIAILEKRDDAMEQLKSKSNYEKAIGFYEDENYNEAIAYFIKVSKNDKKILEAAEYIAEIDKQIVSQIKGEFENGKDDYALDLLNDYLEEFPNSTLAINLKNEIESAKKDAAAKAEQELAMAKAKEEQALAAKAEQAAKEEKQRAAVLTAQQLVGSYQTIVSKTGNLRAAPKLNASIVAVMPQGAGCYVYETKIELATRIWCRVEYIDGYGIRYIGWVSYNTMNYTED